MSDTIRIDLLNDVQKQGLVCMYYSRMHKTDPRYKNRINDFRVLEKRFNRKVNTYKNDKDAFDKYFPDNGRVGWQDWKSLDDRRSGYQYVYDTYKDCDDSMLENAVREIISIFSSEENVYVSMKCGFVDTVHEILNGTEIITVDGIYTLKEELKEGRIVFLTLGGDIGKSEVDWEPGFIGIAHVARSPYDFGYNGKDKYFKIDIAIDCIFEEPFKREDFVNYRDAYDAAYIGPELSRDPSQAISSLDTIKAVSIIRAILDKYPYLESKLLAIFGEEIMDRAKGAVRMLIPVSLELGETTEDIVSSVKTEITIEEESEIENDEEGGDKNYISGGTNVLFYGVPGSGKSHTVEGIVKGADYVRVVFHPEYTYSDFIGQIMPRIQKNDSGEEKLTYVFSPGPFTEAIKAAEKKRGEMHYLVIEEINRGNAPAIFGDVFQLLDREEDGTGKFTINNYDIAREVYGKGLENRPIRIPSNLTILATMNTSDQNVFTLDTAFQRRWNMRYIPNDVFSAEHADKMIDERAEITWGQFASFVNDEIANYNNASISSEDKQLGAYFVKGDELNKEKFAEKALKYLWDDVYRMDREEFFSPEIKSIGQMLEVYTKASNAPLKGIMKTEVYERMMSGSATSNKEAFESQNETFEYTDPNKD